MPALVMLVLTLHLGSLIRSFHMGQRHSHLFVLGAYGITFGRTPTIIVQAWLRVKQLQQLLREVLLDCFFGSTSLLSPDVHLHGARWRYLRQHRRQFLAFRNVV